MFSHASSLFFDRCVTRPGVINVCGLFWDVPIVGNNSRAGILIHEASHFQQNGFCADLAYGPSASKTLAQLHPDDAIYNADSHEYFAENTPPLN